MLSHHRVCPGTWMKWNVANNFDGIEKEVNARICLLTLMRMLQISNQSQLNQSQIVNISEMVNQIENVKDDKKENKKKRRKIGKQRTNIENKDNIIRLKQYHLPNYFCVHHLFWFRIDRFSVSFRQCTKAIKWYSHVYSKTLATRQCWQSTLQSMKFWLTISFVSENDLVFNYWGFTVFKRKTTTKKPVGWNTIDKNQWNDGIEKIKREKEAKNTKKKNENKTTK